MSYDLKLFRKEIRKQYSNLAFLEHEESITPFTEKQFERLKKGLSIYKYEVVAETDDLIEYNFKGGQLGITVYLSKTSLTFKCAGGGEAGLFEIIQTSSEFSDSEFLTLDLQTGTWDGMCLEAELEAEKNEQSGQLPTEIEQSIKKPWWKFW